MTITNILWPTDLSPNAAKALPLVRLMSEKLSAAVHLLYVVDDLRRFDHFYGDAAPGMLEALQKAEYTSADSMMTRVCQKDLAGCPNYRHLLRQGDPAEQILRLAEEIPADLIIMATHGAGRLEGQSRFFGSVADKVIKGAKTPVLTVPMG